MKQPGYALWLIAAALLQAGCQDTRVLRPTPSDQSDLGSLPSSAALDAPAQERAPSRTEDAPLPLDEGLGLSMSVEGGADNSRCAVCHLNLIGEELARTHAQAEIGCADCHGPSDAHIADESWASGGNGTAPDMMFPKHQINPACLECHPQDELSHREHEALLAGRSQKKHCTDCHGEHRLVNRKCQWK